MTVPSSAVTLELIDDIAVVPLDVSSFQQLELKHRIAAYYFARAARAGDRITFDQGNRYHLPMLDLLEHIVSAAPVLPGDLLERLTLFLKKLWLCRGNHHVDSTLKLVPPFSPEELHRAVTAAATRLGPPPMAEGVGLEHHLRTLGRVFFDPDFDHQVTCKSPPEGKDVVTASAVNYYDGVTERDVLAFHGRHPLNSRLVRNGSSLVEEVWRAGGDGVPPGRYAGALGEIVRCLEAAMAYVEPAQRDYLRPLVRFFRTGDVESFRDYNRAWIHCETPIDVIIGFIEQYKDPLGHRGEFEGTVYAPDPARAFIMRTLAREAGWFEAHMPWDSAYSRPRVEVAQAQVSDLLTLSGSTAPFGYSGVNLPNETRLREEHGTRSLLVGNIPRQRREVTGDALLREFSPTPEALARAQRWSAEAWEMIVALHEVIGHASGRVSPDLVGEPEDHLREYYSTLEEARADLVALWHLFSPRLLELGLIPSSELAMEGVWSLVRSAMGTIGQMEEPFAEEDHDRAELMIVNCLIDRKAGIAEVRQDGRTFWVVTDIEAVRRGVGRLLSEIMRIKAHGDYNGIRALVERYGVRIDPELHRELRARVLSLGVPERVAFMSPELELVRDGDGRIIDVALGFSPDFLTEQMRISRLYRSL